MGAGSPRTVKKPAGWWSGVSAKQGPGPKVAWPTLFHLRAFLMASARIGSLKSFAEAPGLGGERSDRKTVPFELSPTVARGVQPCSLWAKILKKNCIHVRGFTEIRKRSKSNKTVSHWYKGLCPCMGGCANPIETDVVGVPPSTCTFTNHMDCANPAKKILTATCIARQAS